MSTRPCRSAHRCADRQCPGCVWRYCRHTTSRILTKSTGPLHTIALTIPDPSPEGFRSWRVEIRNRLDYLRRSGAAWREFGIHVWLQRDGTIRGIITRGLLGLDEVVMGLERWEATLRPEIAAENLRAAIWSATKPRVIYADGSVQRRYWPVRCSIWPCRAEERCPLHASDLMRDQIEPMTWLM